MTDATVDVWHTSVAGLYSGEDAALMCTSGDAQARSGRRFRGVQATDAQGRVDFDTCFPGWYRGRAIHIHFTVRRGGAEFVTSQLAFEQGLIDEVFSSHPEYALYGAPDTPNARDGILSRDLPAFLLRGERMDDGALLASKRLVVRSSLADPLCASG